MFVCLSSLFSPFFSLLAVPVHSNCLHICVCHKKRRGRLCLDLGNLALLGALLLGLVLAGKHGTTVLVEFQLGDLHVAGVNADEVGATVELSAGDLLDVDHPLLAVASNNLAGLFLLALVASDDDDLVVLADGERADVVLLTELLGEGSAHHDATDVRRSVVAGATCLSARAGDVYLGLKKKR